jgi:hypothetical protein
LLSSGSITYLIQDLCPVPTLGTVGGRTRLKSFAGFELGLACAFNPSPGPAFCPAVFFVGLPSGIFFNGSRRHE